MSIELHVGDLPDGLDLAATARDNAIAIDTETMGLNPHRDRLCLVQLSTGDGSAHLVQFRQGAYDAPNLKRLLTDPAVTKLFHFARFDVAVMKAYLGITCQPIYCTKVASKLVRTFTDKHGLKDLSKDLLGVEMSKQQQSSDWGAADLNAEQMKYAASDVLHLHDLKAKLDVMLAREGRTHLAKACFDFLPARGELDLGGWEIPDILAH
ncbi:ribonuclease D [Azospirillum griseum]|uniref:Ribonuclease D n=1 Tax=Azospirillum griseum TaxID=2496639 RepID=A0A3S0JI09_9PROT|nr:ribonuclease H-like domain-containing protein [Azospirillum griseum]RTR19791.1 ribonuclease D [Azospirillum griseum]